MPIVPLEYYHHHDVLFVSKDLLGKFLFTRFHDVLTGGMIIETEAYSGPEDKASHAFGNRRTKRNEVMYNIGGCCYVYRCYGIHNLFNIVTNKKDIPHAILIRGISPTVGIEKMLERRKKNKLDKSLASGPGTLTEALGIQLEHNGLMLNGPEIWVEESNVQIPKGNILVGPRVGIDYAGEHALLPWRFQLTHPEKFK